MTSPHNTYTHIVSEFKKYFDKSGRRRAVLGVSGGIDSALALKLAIDALGEDNVTALIMPEHGVTSDENNIHAKRLCEFLRVRRFVIPINKYLLDLLQLPWQPSELAQINTKARARAVIMYNYANTENALVIGTSNKSELALGYGTKYGDLAADILPLGGLYKTDVYKLAEYLGLPDEIIRKAPTAELYKDQTDEKELGAPYSLLDPLLKELDSGASEEEILSEVSKQPNRFGLTRPVVENILSRIKKNKHKLELPHVITT